MPWSPNVRPISAALLAVAATMIPAAAARGDDWPQWRGPRRDGVWRETGILERFPKPRLEAEWRTPVGPGYSGPAVAAGKVYLLDKRERSERVLCLDAAKGAILWTREYPCEYRNVGYGSGPRATPTVEGGKVWTVGAMGHLHCLDAGDGRVIWAKDYVRDFGLRVPTWGVASAPLVDGERLIALAGGADGAMVVAFRKDSGEEIWRSLPTQPMGYGPPTLVEAGGARQLVLWLPQRIVSLDPATGRPFWEEPCDVTHGMTVASPVLDGEHLLVSAFYDGSILLRLLPDRPAAEVLWRGRSKSEMEDQTDGLHCMISTPILKGDELFGVCSYGALRCLDAKTGKRLWATYEATGNGRWWNAFLIQHGERVFLANEQGDLILAMLSREGYREISRTKLLDPTNKAQGRDVVWSHPAFAYRRVFARNDREIICASLEAEPAVAPAAGAGR